MPKTKPTQMERARAARAMVDATRRQSVEMAAFLEIFHPELDDDTRRELINDARDNDRR